MSSLFAKCPPDSGCEVCYPTRKKPLGLWLAAAVFVVAIALILLL